MDARFPRIERLPPYVFNVIGEMRQGARAAGEDVIDFSMGNPDQPTPEHIVKKLVETANREDTHRYSQSKGIPRLRRAMAAWYKTRFEVDLDPETEVITTIGSKEGLAHLAMATLGPGDAVLVPNPAYPIHPYGFVIAGADIRHVPLLPGEDFFAELVKAIETSWPRPKMLVLNFPANPTAMCVELNFFEKLVEIAKEHDIWVIQDIAYADIVFDGYVAPSILQVRGAKEYESALQPPREQLLLRRLKLVNGDHAVADGALAVDGGEHEVQLEVLPQVREQQPELGLLDVVGALAAAHVL